VRVRSRNAWIGPGGTRLARISPCANKSAIQVASLTSLLRPGTLRICAGLARRSSSSPSRICHTGFQLNAGCLHRDVRAARLTQPVAERQQFRRGGSPAADLMPYLSALLHPQASDHGRFVDIQPRATLMKYFHYALLHHAAGARPSTANSISRAREPSGPRQQSRVLAGPQVKLTLGLRAPGKKRRPRCRQRGVSLLAGFIHQGARSA
jgi:hypothetical protein